MIPKKIHYCWFGKQELPLLAKQCIASWEKFFPDYEIIRWDENNFNIFECPYVQEAYSEKKWAFVSDYARFKILYENGGVYFDTDVEVIKSFNTILSKGAFMGLEHDYRVNPGLGIAAAPGLKIYQEILEKYKKLHFKGINGQLNVTTVVTYTTNILKKHGFVSGKDIQEVAGIYIYPTEYFCPKDYLTGKTTITANTLSIHHFTASWHNPCEKYTWQLQHKLVKYFPPKLSGRIAFAISKIRYEGIKSLLRYIINKKK